MPEVSIISASIIFLLFQITTGLSESQHPPATNTNTCLPLHPSDLLKNPAYTRNLSHNGASIPPPNGHHSFPDAAPAASDTIPANFNNNTIPLKYCSSITNPTAARNSGRVNRWHEGSNGRKSNYSARARRERASTRHESQEFS